MTRETSQKVCDGMSSGTDPQCIRADSEHFQPVAKTSGGALSMTDGKKQIWFHNPDGAGWIHKDYYLRYLNETK